MTREEAIFRLERDNPNNIAIRAGFESLYDQRKEAFSMAIKALEQEPILDKAIAEIERVGCVCHASDNYDELIRKNIVLKILNKYKAKSEG